MYNLDGKATHTIQRVERLDNRLQDVHSGVQAANQVGVLTAHCTGRGQVDCSHHQFIVLAGNSV